jgi:hypothetical protein
MNSTRGVWRTVIGNSGAAIAPRRDSFDVTAAPLVSGLITERGVLRAEQEVLRQAFPERHKPRMKAVLASPKAELLTAVLPRSVSLA